MDRSWEIIFTTEIIIVDAFRVKKKMCALIYHSEMLSTEIVERELLSEFSGLGCELGRPNISIIISRKHPPVIRAVSTRQ